MTPGRRSAVEAFIRDKDPRAYEKLIDRLLASPHYGERWARHWLDGARFAESQGFEYERIREHARRYQDYVIAALNKDKSYDRFVEEQVAGDTLLKDLKQRGMLQGTLLLPRNRGFLCLDRV